MMRKVRHIQDVVDWRLCVGCGACYAVCEKKGVQLVNYESEGIRPVFNPEICEGCTDCLPVCPGREVNGRLAIGDSPYTSIGDHEYGPALELWEGYATDPGIREQASSGGLLTALSLFCLEEAGMQGVIHAGMAPEKPWLNRTTISRKRDELLSRTGSRYAPASPCEGLRGLEEKQGSWVFVGKPCDAAGARMLMKQKPAFQDRIGMILSFCCAGTPSTRGTLDQIDGMGVQPGEVRALRYRGEGWPGGLKVETDAGTAGFVPYQEAWGRLTKYVPFRCRLCADGLGRLADITCGDAWESYMEEKVDAGRSIVLVRTERGRELLRRAREAGVVHLEPIQQKDVLAAQPNLLQKRRNLLGRQAGMSLLAVPVPRYPHFSLWQGWKSLPLKEKIRSIFGTARRVLQRGLYRRCKR